MTLAEQLQYLKSSVRKNDPKSQQHSLDALQLFSWPPVEDQFPSHPLEST
jgi:hypothetical protein